jgi:hypothetical protein
MGEIAWEIKTDGQGKVVGKFEGEEVAPVTWYPA